ncbi:ImuA family protein [Sphingomonas montanisoli]|uniref:Protein ImuA n=1 Tax=Sphingomonas montanisoli TaxID=2606412 RepID=A0A5D9C6E6_9SPHN|nr:hypothetical protein [Sphingomonas montanisoli]TZG27418.1 hypothetical protein FYJ91_07435 [Sphingomonas montanisoli]
MPAPNHLLASLRARVDAIEGVKPKERARFALGHPGLDARLDGGLPLGRLHEVFAAQPEDQAAAIAFALVLAMQGGTGPVVWVRQDDAVKISGRLHPPGLVDLGFDPARLVEVLAPDEKALLRAAGDAVRCPDVALLLVEPGRAARTIDLTATRRLSVAAEASGVTVLLLRGSGEPAPSAAHSRWRIRAVPAVPLEADAPGHGTIDLTLLRHRGGIAEFSLTLEWNRDQFAFREPALSGAVVPLPAHRPAVA